MGWGTGNLGGGSGGGLNFKVVGNPQPSNPKENTIWLNTDVDITGYYLQAEQPEGMAEGEVWISVGTESGVAFSATKKNPVMVYPISAKQYVSGAWVDKTAKSYQGGEWVSWMKYLYNNGDECTDITGGWVPQTETNGRATKNADHIALSYTGSSLTGAIVDTANKIDVTGYSTLVFDLSATVGLGTFGWVAGLTTAPDLGAGWNYHKEGGGNYVAAIGTMTSVSRDEMTLDISHISGKYYVEIASAGGSVNLYSVKLQ